MADTDPSSELSYASKLKASLTDPRILFFIALALAAGAGGTFIGSRVYLKPVREIAYARFQAQAALMSLYDLQMSFRTAHGAFANDLDTLLASSPDGEKLRAKLAASVDINTLAVVGDANRFRLEANIRDAERTSVKIRGPLGER